MFRLLSVQQRIKSGSDEMNEIDLPVPVVAAVVLEVSCTVDPMVCEPVEFVTKDTVASETLSVE